MKEKKITITPRWLARRMAKAKLDGEGATGYNKKPKTFDAPALSYFQRKWREIALKARDEAQKRERTRMKVHTRKKART